MAGALTISGTQTGISGGSFVIGPFTITMGAVGQTTEVALSSGANTITVPAGSVGCVIVPPSANTVALTLKGVTGDTGVALSKTGPTLLSFDASPPANFCLTAASAISSVTEIKFF